MISLDKQPIKLASHFNQKVLDSRKVSAKAVDAQQEQDDQNPELPVLHLDSSLNEFPLSDHSAMLVANLYDNVPNERRT